jgi:large subunit ribosomal protein L30
MKKVRVKLVKSTICVRESHKRTVEALGLKRLNSVVEKELNPQIAGMIDTVRYLLQVEELEA